MNTENLEKRSTPAVPSAIHAGDAVGVKNSVKQQYDPDAELKALTLVEKIQNGDEEAFQLLTVQYKQLVDSMVYRFAPSLGLSDVNTNAMGFGMDELRQDGYVALYKAAISYAPTEDKKGKSVRFGLYAKICIRNAYITEVRKYKRALRRIEKETTAGERKRLDWFQSIRLTESESGDGELLKQICDSLSAFEKSVFMQYIDGKPPRVIARELNRSERSVSNAIYRIKTKNIGLLGRTPESSDNG